MPSRIVFTEGETMKPEIKVEPIKPDNRVRNIALLAGVLLVVFLLGFIPMWLKSRQATTVLRRRRSQSNKRGCKMIGVSGDRRAPWRL